MEEMRTGEPEEGGGGGEVNEAEVFWEGGSREGWRGHILLLHAQRVRGRGQEGTLPASLACFLQSKQGWSVQGGLGGASISWVPQIRTLKPREDKQLALCPGFEPLQSSTAVVVPL